jgi:hypothetical protein
MWAVRDLAGGSKPSPMNLFYNGSVSADCVTKRYKGSLVKLTDEDNANGQFCTWGGDTTLYESLFGILEEETGLTGNYLPDDTTYGMVTKKITPLIPSTICRAEYAQNDPNGTSVLDTAASASAAGTALTMTLTGDDDYQAGGWVYFTNGLNANYLHYVITNNTTGMTFGTGVTGAVVTADDFIVIQPANCSWFKMCDHEVNIESEGILSARTLPVVGLMHYLTDDGIPFQRLDRDKHDGLKLNNPRFYHDFVIGGHATTGNIWRDVRVIA